LLEDLARRGLDFSTPRLYVLDGAKALYAAVKRHAGEAALVQRCQVHKRRNVLEKLPDEYQPGIERKLLAAYAMVDHADARRALDQIHLELERINPSAARSLEEGMEETLTVHKLRVPELLRKSLASTNIIESAFSVAEELCRRVKRWREGDHRERWAGSGAETRGKRPTPLSHVFRPATCHVNDRPGGTDRRIDLPTVPARHFRTTSAVQLGFWWLRWYINPRS
jgi:putative transposase